MCSAQIALSTHEFCRCVRGDGHPVLEYSQALRIQTSAVGLSSEDVRPIASKVASSRSSGPGVRNKEGISAAWGVIDRVSLKLHSHVDVELPIRNEPHYETVTCAFVI